VAQELGRMDFQRVFVLKGGWREWSIANYPIEQK
jgi:3-mercaptopyruvate sulfurtransferase SseA